MPEIDVLAHFHFLRPYWMLLFLPFFAIWILLRRQEKTGAMFEGIIAPDLLEHLRITRFKSRWFNPQSFSIVFVILLFIILLGPSWRQQPSPLSQDEAALAILLDVSASMTQRDVQPSRLKRAKQKVSDLLALRPDKKAALIVYAGSSHTVLSLTSDPTILQQYLAAIEPNMMPRPGKFPEYSLTEVDKVLRQTTAPATLLLIGDGVGSDTTDAFKQYFDASQHQLLVLGIGSESSTDSDIPLEQAKLQQLADVSGGSYIKLTLDDNDVKKMNAKINNHFVILDDEALPWLDSGYPLVFPALAIFLMWFRKGWTLTWAWLLLPLLLVPAPDRALAQTSTTADVSSDAADQHWDIAQWFAELWLTPDQQGRLLMNRTRYDAAASHFEDPTWKAMAYYYGEQFMLAAEYFSRTDSDDALFNEANARAHARDYVRARNRYDRLLARAPDYPGAVENRARVQELIDEINRLSESQQEEAGVSGEDKELGGDDAIPADGAEELSFEQAELIQLTAEEILQDPATSEMWLRSVQQDPSEFLAIKFTMQLQARETEQKDATP